VLSPFAQPPDRNGNPEMAIRARAVAKPEATAELAALCEELAK